MSGGGGACGVTATREVLLFFLLQDSRLIISEMAIMALIPYLNVKKVIFFITVNLTLTQLIEYLI